MMNHGIEILISWWNRISKSLSQNLLVDEFQK